ncbi:MAG: DUF364 domain-containing protein [Kiritimatiellia bacterium]
MKILQDIIESLKPNAGPVKTVCTGAFWTAVVSKYGGLSCTYRDMDPQHDDSPKFVEDAGKLLDKSALELARYALSGHTVAASIGMAAINSLIDVDESKCSSLNAAEIVMEKGAGKNVAVVGHFPFIPKLREKAKTVWVIEKKPRPGDLPAEEAAEILPQCDVVCLTSSAFINHTIEDLLPLCKNSFVVLTGPTSPLTPMLFDHGVDVICGARITDPASVIRCITQGACFRQLKFAGVKLLSLAK